MQHVKQGGRKREGRNRLWAGKIILTALWLLLTTTRAAAVPNYQLFPFEQYPATGTFSPGYTPGRLVFACRYENPYLLDDFHSAGAAVGVGIQQVQLLLNVDATGVADVYREYGLSTSLSGRLIKELYGRCSFRETIELFAGDVERYHSRNISVVAGYRTTGWWEPFAGIHIQLPEKEPEGHLGTFIAPDSIHRFALVAGRGPESTWYFIFSHSFRLFSRLGLHWALYDWPVRLEAGFVFTLFGKNTLNMSYRTHRVLGSTWTSSLCGYPLPD